MMTVMDRLDRYLANFFEINALLLRERQLVISTYTSAIIYFAIIFQIPQCDGLFFLCLPQNPCVLQQAPRTARCKTAYFLEKWMLSCSAFGELILL